MKHSFFGFSGGCGMLNDFIHRRMEFFEENNYLSEGDFRRFFSGHRGASMLPSDDLNALSRVSEFYKVHSELLANRINERGEINPLTEAELKTLHTHLSAIRAEIGGHLDNIDTPNPDVKTWLTDAFMFRLATELATANENDDEKSNSVKKALLATYQQMGAAGYKDNAEAGIKAWHQTFHDELFNGPGGLMPDFIISNSLQAIFSQKIGMREAHLVPDIQKQLERMAEVLLDTSQQKILQIDAYKQIAALSNIFVDLEKGDTNSYKQLFTTNLP